MNNEENYSNKQRVSYEKINQQMANVGEKGLVQNVMESSPGYVLVLNEQRQIVAANRKFLSTFGFKNIESAKGLRPGEAFLCGNRSAELGCGCGPLCSRCTMFGAILKSLQEKAIVSGESYMATETINGEFEIFVSSVEFEREPYVVVTLMDVTKQRDLQRQYNAAMQEMYCSAKMSSMITLASGLAHEINNPLSILMGNISFIQNKYQADNETIFLIAKAIKAGERIENIVREMLRLSTKQYDAFMVFSVTECLKKLFSILKGDLARFGIDLTLNISGDHCNTRGFLFDFEQAISHIIQNARDGVAAQSGNAKSILVTVNTLNEQIFITVQDNGCGIEPENLKKITDPFFTTKPPGKGMGLGLSYVYQVVHSMKGSLGIESVFGKGTVVNVVLPMITQ